MLSMEYRSEQGSRNIFGPDEMGHFHDKMRQDEKEHFIEETGNFQNKKGDFSRGFFGTQHLALVFGKIAVDIHYDHTQ